MTNPDELLIIKNVLAGDQDAFGVLVDKYQDMAYTIAVRILKDPHEAADVVQESFIKGYQVLNTFRGDAKFSTWIYRIVYRKSLDRLKSLKRRKTEVYDRMELLPGTTGDGNNALQQIMQDERMELVKEAVSRLKPEEQTLIMLYYFEESPVKDIAEILGIGMENVKVKLFRTRKKLFDLLAGPIENTAV